MYQRSSQQRGSITLFINESFLLKEKVMLQEMKNYRHNMGFHIYTKIQQMKPFANANLLFLKSD